MSRPTIAVAVPAYNAAAWITETLESVVTQTTPPDELIVVDDGSTDNTAERATAVDPRIRVIRQQNRGAPGAYNRGFLEASSDFVAMCPADDIWQPKKLELQLETLHTHANVDIAFGGAELFGRMSGTFPQPDRAGLLDNHRFLPAMYERCLIPAPTALVRRALHERLGGFREDIAIEDYEFWLRALKSGALFHFDPRLLTRLRQHDTNLGSANALLVWELNLQIHRLYRDVVDEDLARRVIGRDLETIGRCRLGLGDLPAARVAYRESLRQRVTLRRLATSMLLHVPGAASLLRRLRPESAGTASGHGPAAG